jgi:hypothetical protein
MPEPFRCGPLIVYDGENCLMVGPVALSWKEARRLSDWLRQALEVEVNDERKSDR